VLHDRATRAAHEHESLALRPEFARVAETEGVPRHRLRRGSIEPATAAQIVRDELYLDGNARQNLATFVTTWMEPEAEALMAETFDKNMIDKDEYPQTAALEERCVAILADLWHAPDDGNPTGTSTTGSSEACMLGGMALRWRWRAAREAAGESADRPNLVLGANAQICWDKFCRYWDVEPRLVPMEVGSTGLTVEKMLPHVDERTIGVVGILGSTQDGIYEPIAELAAALDDLEARTGLDVPIHVDGASGGFVAPFLDPDLVWDFRLPRVSSINTSGHKYGLVYPGVGWVLWRDTAHLPEDLVFHVNYLGGDMPTFAINFSRPGSQVVAQYYNFLRLGFDGYRQIHQACRDTAMHLASAVAAMGPFELVSDGSQLPVLAFRLAEGVDRYTVYDVSDRLRMRGWQVPAYTFPAHLEHVAVLRIVVKNGFGRDLADLLLDDLRRAVEHLGSLDAPQPQPPTRAERFHH
jgi:glutamate decarboxylase